MGKKILYCASTASHILNFHLPYLQYFKEQGWQVDVAVAGATAIPYADNVVELPLKKSLLAIGNLRTVYSVKHLLREKRYDVISTHTTLAGAVVRLAVRLMRKWNGKVVHTSHGYFFNREGCPTEWPYLLAEKLLAPVTDVLMVMNDVDHRLAVRHRLGKKVVLIPGMGLDLDRFVRVEKEKKEALKVAARFAADDFLIIYAAEMSRRKNQGELIRAFALATAQEPSLRLLLVGDGILKADYMEMTRKYGLSARICFPGHVSDMALWYAMCDVAVSTSRSEGLPFNVMEAMACGLPVIASRIKGHVDLLERMEDSLLYNLGDERSLSDKLLLLYRDRRLGDKVGNENLCIVQQYEIELVKSVIVAGYEEDTRLQNIT